MKTVIFTIIEYLIVLLIAYATIVPRLKKIPARVIDFYFWRRESKADIDDLYLNCKISDKQYDILYSILYSVDSLAWYRFFFDWENFLSKSNNSIINRFNSTRFKFKYKFENKRKIDTFKEDVAIDRNYKYTSNINLADSSKPSGLADLLDKWYMK